MTEQDKNDSTNDLDPNILINSILKLGSLLCDIINLNHRVNLNNLDYHNVLRCSEKYREIEISWEVAREIMVHATEMHIDGIEIKPELLARDKSGNPERGVIDTYAMIREVTRQIEEMYNSPEEDL